MIKLFRSTDTVFSSLGIGILKDALSCTVKEERNGAFILEMTYPADGAYFDQIALRGIIVAKPNPYDSPQAFRIHKISKSIDQTISIEAEHISYDMNGITVTPFVAMWDEHGTKEILPNIFGAIHDNSCPESPFYLDTDVSTKRDPIDDSIKKYSNEEPKTMRSILMDDSSDVSLMNLEKSEWSFDNYTAYLHKARGQDRGVTIRYGVDLIDMKQEEYCNDLYTGIIPYLKNSTTGTTQLIDNSASHTGGVDKYVVYVSEAYDTDPPSYDFQRFMPYNAANYFNQEPPASQFNAAMIACAKKYIKDNEVGIPKVSLSISFLDLRKRGMISLASRLKEVKLCDTITVVFPKLNVKTKAKIVKTEYDVILDEYKSIEVGEPKVDITRKIRTNAVEVSNLKFDASGDAIIRKINEATPLNVIGTIKISAPGTREGTLDDSLKDTISKITEYYTIVPDDITPEYPKPTGATYDWTETVPTSEEGKYIWKVTETEYVNNEKESTISGPVCISGYNGINTARVRIYGRFQNEPDPPLIDETQGLTYDFVNKTFTPPIDSSTGWHTVFSDAVGTYPLWVCEVVISSSSNTATFYDWGTPAIYVENGTNGVSSYTHIKYANVPNPTAAQMRDDTGLYIGICVSTDPIAPTDPLRYTWRKFTGEDGTSVRILGSYNSLAELKAEHPTGSEGDGYLINGDLYVWKISNNKKIISSDTTWDLKHYYTTGGVYQSNNSFATSDYIAVQPNTTIHNQCDPIGMGGSSTMFFVNEFEGSVWKRRTTVTDNIVLNSATTQVRLTFGYSSATGNVITQDDIDQHFQCLFVSGTPGSYSDWYNAGRIQGPSGANSYFHVKYADSNNPTVMYEDPTGRSYIGTYADTIYEDSDDPTKYKWSKYAGNDAYNRAFVQLFQRKSTNPGSVSYSGNITYNFTNGTLSTLPGNWKTSLSGITAGSDPVWETHVILNTKNTSANIVSNDWSYPVKYTENGTNGSNAITLQIFLRSASTPSKPSGTFTYNFQNDTITGPSLGSWKRSMLDAVGTDPMYSCQATVRTTENTQTFTWSDPKVVMENGLNSKTIDIFRRSNNSTMTAPSGGSYTFSTNTLSSIPTNWSISDPGGTSLKLWKSSTTVTGYSNTVSVTSWSTPVVVSTPSINNAKLTVYIRSAADTMPSPPEGLTYTFSSGAITSGTLGNWKRSISELPDGTNPIWASEVTLNTTSNTATFDFPSPKIVIENGADGQPGLNHAEITIYIRTSAGQTPTIPNGSTTYTFANPQGYVAPAGWSTSFPSLVNKTDKLWSTKISISSQNATYTINKLDWPNPQIFSENGTDGTKGDTGKSLSSSTQQWYAHTSTDPTSIPSSATWLTAPPEYDESKFIFIRYKQVWSNPSSTTYTTPVLDNTLNTLGARVVDSEDSIGMVILKEGQNKTINAASIVASINDDGTSQTIIDSDRLQLTGDLDVGTANVNGGCITAGKIVGAANPDVYFDLNEGIIQSNYLQGHSYRANISDATDGSNFGFEIDEKANDLWEPIVSVQGFIISNKMSASIAFPYEKRAIPVGTSKYKYTYLEIDKSTLTGRPRIYMMDSDASDPEKVCIFDTDHMRKDSIFSNGDIDGFTDYIITGSSTYPTKCGIYTVNGITTIDQSQFPKGFPVDDGTTPGSRNGTLLIYGGTARMTGDTSREYYTHVLTCQNGQYTFVALTETLATPPTRWYKYSGTIVQAKA